MWGEKYHQTKLTQRWSILRSFTDASVEYKEWKFWLFPNYIFIQNPRKSCLGLKGSFMANSSYSTLRAWPVPTRAVEPEPKIFWMMEPEPEIWVPVQAIYANNTMFFLFLDQIVLEPEPKKLDCCSRSLKFEYRLHSSGSNQFEWSQRVRLISVNALTKFNKQRTEEKEVAQ